MVKLHACIVLQEDGEKLFQKHVEQWQQLYQQGGMEIEGNLELVSGLYFLSICGTKTSTDCYKLRRFYRLHILSIEYILYSSLIQRSSHDIFLKV